MQTTRVGRFTEVASVIRCLYCEGVGTLMEVEGSLVCRDCTHVYGLANGRPILLNGESAAAFDEELSRRSGRAMVDEYAALGAPSGKQRWGRRLLSWIRPPAVMLHYNPDLTRRRDTWDVLTHRGSQTRVLNVGGGPQRYSDSEITLNIRPFHNVDVVGDGHNIPFADDAFDSVICVAVLEHVRAPEKIVAEMIRVLKPGGKLYAEIPFIFFFHGYPNDFRRYTLEGMKYLFRDLQHPTFGLTQGPVSAALQTVNATIDVLLPRRSVIIRKAVNGAFRWAFFWLKYLDIPLQHRAEAHQVAGGFWVLGTKAAQPPDARDAG